MNFIMTVVLVVEQPHFIDGIVRLSTVLTPLRNKVYLILILWVWRTNGKTPDNSIIIFLKSSYNIRDIQSIVVYGHLDNVIQVF